MNIITCVIYIYIYFACLGVCLFVCVYQINVKTAEPIAPNVFVGPYMTTGKVYEWSKFQIFVKKFFIFLKFWKSTKYFDEIRELFYVLFYNVH